jgi:predicted permease
MESTIRVLNQALPILLLMALGYWVRRRGFLAQTTIDDLRKVVVNLALPAVLFISFLGIELRPSYFVLFGVVFSLCVLLFLLGLLLKRLLHIRDPYFPYLVTGFEYGMLGVSLFGAAYGLDKIGYIAVVDLGHEVFIWFVFLPLLLIRRDGAQNPRQVVKSFLSAPVVIAIVISLLFNVLGGQVWLYQLPVAGAVMAALEFLGDLTVPLILITVGYGIQLRQARLKDVAFLVLLRLGILLPLALFPNSYLVRDLLGLDRWFEVALFTLLVLPPPFIIPLYASSDLDSEQRQHINNVLTMHTIISVIVFLVYFAVNPVQ